MSTEVTVYDDEFCCDECELVCDEVYDAYGGDYCTKFTYICKKHKEVFYEYIGGRFSGIEKEYKNEIIKEIFE